MQTYGEGLQVRLITRSTLGLYVKTTQLHWRSVRLWTFKRAWTDPFQAMREARKQLDELEKLLAEELDEFLEEERTDLPSTPEKSILWGSEASDVGSDEGDGENELTLKLEDEQP
jgi:hypothetical protein